MRQIVTYFWQICVLKAGPQQLPRSTAVLSFIFALYFLVAAITVATTRPQQNLVGILGGALIGVLLEAFIVWCLLLYKQVTWRFIATMSALLGTNAIILVILMPMNMIMINIGQDTTIRFITELAALVCLGWWLAIAGWILHHAVNISILQGAALVFVVELLSIMATRSLFPT